MAFLDLCDDIVDPLNTIPTGEIHLLTDQLPVVRCKKASELQPGDIRSWDTPMYDEAEKLQLIQSCKPSEKPEGRFFLVSQCKCD